MKNLRKQRGFTLIELLVVVSIIALLAVGVVPIYGKIMLRVKANTAMQAASQIQKGLFAYASSNDQMFPNQTPDDGDFSDSNTAYRQLFVRDFVDDEKLFFVQGSAWHGKKSGPDGDRGTSENNFSQALEGGENHWGYVSGLSTDRSDSTLPIVMDGGIDGSPGKWTANEKEKGGCWKGKYAITVRVGGSAKVNELVGSDLVVKDKRGGSEVDIFSDTYGTETANLLNPASQ